MIQKLFLRRVAVLWVGLFMAVLYHNPAQAQDDVFTPEHIAKMSLVTSAAISPDGNHVAYTVSVQADPTVENTFNTTQLHVVSLSNGETRPFFTQSSVSAVTFRPNHGTITFLSRPSGSSSNALFEVAIDGGEAQKLFQFDRNILGYEWANDGNHIAFMAFEEMDRSVNDLPYQPQVFEEMLPNRRLFIQNVNVDGHTPHEIDIEGSVYKVAWSPNRDRLAVSAAPTPHIDDRYMFQRVHIVDYASKEVSHTLDNEGKIGQIVWSPDGTRIALRNGHDIHDPIDGRIMVVSANGGTPVNINPDFKGKYEQIRWTANNEITFLASEGVERSFGTIRPDGTRKSYRVNPGGPALMSFSLASNGAAAFVASTPQHPNEVYTLDRRSRNLERVTDTNPWLADLRLGEQRVVRYEARDGEFEIEGLLILPVDYVEGTAVPLITMVHGGPEAHYSNGWLTNYSMPGQFGAARGFATFYPNYRGSTGRGMEFIYSSQADLAGKEFDDVVDGVDYLIAAGIADADRIGVTGGSYGGYATAWMSTKYSERFAAGVMFVGISNNLSKWGTSDIPEELYLVHSRERMWESDEKWMDYLRRSPIYHVDNANTPLLIMHGAEDTRVHPGQSLELYRHLRVRRPEVPVRLVLYPNEGHGNARSTSRYDYNLRMIQWFETFLKGDGQMPDARISH